MAKVSVIMSVYNGGKYLVESIESILNQTFKDWEFVIIDDGSTDGTGELLESYRDERFKIVPQGRMGLTKSLNAAIRMVRGDYIARMDADCVALPSRLKVQVDFLDQHQDIAMVGTGYSQLDFAGKVVSKNILPVSDREIRRVIIKLNPFCHFSVMLRRSVFEKVGLYDENFEYGEDYELWLRVVREFKLANLPDCLVRHQYSESSITIAHRNEQLGCEMRARVRAIKGMGYPFYSYLYVMKTYMRMKTPVVIRNFLKKIL